MNELVPILISWGAALLGGFLAGYFLRKILKIVAIIIGAFIFVLIALQGVGWVEADYQKISNDTVNFVTNTNVYEPVVSFVNEFNPVVFVFLGVGVIAGFIKAGK